MGRAYHGQHRALGKQVAIKYVGVNSQIFKNCQGDSLPEQRRVRSSITHILFRCLISAH